MWIRFAIVIKLLVKEYLGKNENLFIVYMNLGKVYDQVHRDALENNEKLCFTSLKEFGRRVHVRWSDKVKAYMCDRRATKVADWIKKGRECLVVGSWRRQTIDRYLNSAWAKVLPFFFFLQYTPLTNKLEMKVIHKKVSSPRHCEILDHSSCS